MTYMAPSPTRVRVEGSETAAITHGSVPPIAGLSVDQIMFPVPRDPGTTPSYRCVVPLKLIVERNHMSSAPLRESNKFTPLIGPMRAFGSESVRSSDVAKTPPPDPQQFVTAPGSEELRANDEPGAVMVQVQLTMF